MKIELDIKPHEIRYRILEPETIAKGSFRRKNITCGVSIVVGCAKGKYKHSQCAAGMKAQALRFDRAVFSAAQAEKWIKKHWRK